MQTQYNIRNFKKPLVLIGLLAFLVSSCGTYNTTVGESDGIYASSNGSQESVEGNEKSSYYKQYFKSKDKDFEDLPEEGAIFTDIESYSTTETIDDEGYIEIEERGYDESYGAWGTNGSGNVTVNVYDNGGWGFNNYWNRPFGFYNAYWGNGFYRPWRGGFGWGFGGFYNDPFWYGGFSPYGFGYGWGFPHYGYYGHNYYNGGYGYAYNNRGRSNGNYGRYQSRANTRSYSRSERTRRSGYTTRTNGNIRNNTRGNTKRSTVRNNTTRNSNVKTPRNTRRTPTVRSNSNTRRTPTVRRSSPTRSSGSVRSSGSTRSSGSRSGGSRSSSSRVRGN